MDTRILHRFTRSFLTQPRALIRLVNASLGALLALGLSDAHAVTRNDLRQYEEDWTKAQQQYYEELKKLKAPRKPEQVQALKDSILTPKKKALQDAYRKFEEPKAKPKGNIPDTDSGHAGSDPSRDAPSEPTVILDGSGVKKEVRYLKKGAPADMTEEESPDFEGPKVLASPGVDSAGEIAYPAKKKPAQDLKNKAP